MHEYRVKIRRVVDGDTVDVDIDLGFGHFMMKQRIRLFGIDTPESRTRDKVAIKLNKPVSVVPLPKGNHQLLACNINVRVHEVLRPKLMVGDVVPK